MYRVAATYYYDQKKNVRLELIHKNPNALGITFLFGGESGIRTHDPICIG
jgi:hypothetical protein